MARRTCAAAWRGRGRWRSAGVLTHAEAEQIVSGLDKIRQSSKRAGSSSTGDEDIHTAVERRLGEIIGPVAGKLHTGRSRNDQVATDFRLWVLEAIEQMDAQLHDLQIGADHARRAGPGWNVLLPGYTHMQRAQPILLSHWWLSHFWALQRDRERLQALARAHGGLARWAAGALAGTAFPIDRDALTHDLGFDRASPNSLDAVSDRDFAAEFLFVAALAGLHQPKLPKR